MTELVVFMHYKKCLYVLLFALTLGYCDAQFNIRIGYSASIGALDEINLIHQEYNQQNAGLLEQELKNIGVMHGLYLGLRYRSNGLGLELSWENVSTTQRAFGLQPGDVFFSDEYSYSLNNFSLGIENYFGKFAYGATVDLRRFASTAVIPNVSEVKRKLVKETKPASKFYITYDVHQGSTVAFSIQPFYQIGWGSYNISRVRPEIIDGATSQNQEINPSYFGVSIMLTNGRQY